MILRIKPRRYYSRGKYRTFFEIQKLTFYGWDNIFHISGFLDFSKRSDAEEFVRLYNAIKRKSI